MRGAEVNHNEKELRKFQNKHGVSPKNYDFIRTSSATAAAKRE